MAQQGRIGRQVGQPAQARQIGGGAQDVQRQLDGRIGEGVVILQVGIEAADGGIQGRQQGEQKEVEVEGIQTKGRGQLLQAGCRAGLHYLVGGLCRPLHGGGVGRCPLCIFGKKPVRRHLPGVEGGQQPAAAF